MALMKPPPEYRGGTKTLPRGREGDEAGLSLWFPTKPEKMPLSRLILLLRRQTKGIFRHFNPTPALFGPGREVQSRHITVVHQLVKCRNITGHDLLPGSKLLVKFVAQHFKHFVFLFRRSAITRLNDAGEAVQ